LVNLEARAVTGCFRTTNQGALASEAGLRPTVTQLENRQRPFGIRLLSLPEGEQARRVVGAPSGIRKRIETALGYAGRTEEIVLPASPEKIGAVIVIEEPNEVKEEAERGRPGLTIFTDGSRLDSGATGYAVTWKSGEKWVGIKAHMGYNQEAYDAECAALARALEVAARRRTTPERVTIFTDAQAAMGRMRTDAPSPGQKYAILVRKWIAELRRARPDICIEIRWCPAHSGVEGNEKADEGAKQAAEEPDARGVEWLEHGDRYGARRMPPPRSLAHLKREISEKKWAEAREWVKKQVKGKRYGIPKRTSREVEWAPKRLASKFHQIRTGHCRTSQYLKWTKNSDTAECGWCKYKVQTREHLFKHCERWKMQQKILWAEVRKETGRGKNRYKNRDLLAYQRCTRSELEFLRTTRVGCRTGPREGTRPPKNGSEEGGEQEKVPGKKGE